MARKKFRTYSKQPHSERSFYEQSYFRDRHYSLEQMDLLNIIRGGEDTYLELKVRFTNTEKIIAEVVALANTGGGAIIFGVNDNHKIEGLDDPDGIEEQLRQICAQDITPPVFPFIDKVAFDNGRRVLVLEVDDRSAPHYAFDHRYYIREGASKREATTEEVMRLYAKLKPTGFESIPLPETSVEDIDEAFVWDYIRACQGERFRTYSYPTQDVLKEMRLAVEYADAMALRVAGIVLFGSEAGIIRRFPRCRVELKRYSGELATAPLIEAATFHGNIAALLERSCGFIKRYCDLWQTPVPKRDRGQRGVAVARGNYCEATVEEIVANALLHRDYNSPQPVRISIFDQKIEVSNPVAGALSKKLIELYGLKSRLNPQLEGFFHSGCYIRPQNHLSLLSARRLHLETTGRELKILQSKEEFKVEIPAA